LNELFKLAEEIRKREEDQIKIAKMKVPPEYHDFIILIRQSMLLSERKPDKNEKLPDGAFINTDGRVYIRVNVPYCKVDGRVKMFADAHVLPDGTRAKYRVESNIEKINEIIENVGDISPKYPLVVRIHSDIFGTLEGVSKINWNGRGADATNPLENAYTSAVGRALALAGFGLLGTGIASAEEMEQALIVRGELFGVKRLDELDAGAGPADTADAEKAADRPAEAPQVPEDPRSQLYVRLKAWAGEKGYPWPETKKFADALAVSLDNESLANCLQDENFQKFTEGIEQVFKSRSGSATEQAQERKEAAGQKASSPKGAPKQAPFTGEVVVADPGKVGDHKGEKLRYAVAEDGRAVAVPLYFKVQKGTVLSFSGKEITYPSGKILLVPDRKTLKIVKKTA
jgi:hypothetical protein